MDIIVEHEFELEEEPCPTFVLEGTVEMTEDDFELKDFNLKDSQHEYANQINDWIQKHSEKIQNILEQEGIDKSIEINDQYIFQEDEYIMSHKPGK